MRKLLFILLISCAGCRTLDIQNADPTAYTQELREITAQIDALERKSLSLAGENNVLRKVFYLYRRASLTGNFDDFKTVETALQDTLRNFGSSQQLSLISAYFNFKLHRLTLAKHDLMEVDKFGGHSQAEILKADIALQEGKYAIAEEAYYRLCKENPSWENLARLAYYKAHTGEQEQADMLYQQAQSKLSVKEMQHFGWLELQRGILDLENKRYHDALTHYRRAEQAYSGYWLIREHIAEVYALLGRKNEAVDLYRAIIAQTNKPEFISALAEIYAVDKKDEASELFQLADDLFAKDYSIYPSAAGGHFIESLLEREKIDPMLLEYAGANHALRPNAQSKFLLAKTYLKLGQRKNAANLMVEVMQSPWRTSDIEVLAHQLELN